MTPPTLRDTGVRWLRSLLAEAGTFLELLLCLAAVVIASTTYNAFFDDRAYLIPVAGAALLGVVVGFAAARRRWHPAVGLAVAVAAFVLYAVYAVFRDETSRGLPGPDALRALGEGVWEGPARMLTVLLPADSTSDLVAPPTLLAYLAGLASAWLVVRRGVLAPLVPPCVMLVGGLLLTAGTPEPRWVLTGAFLACCLVLALLRANAPQNLPEASAAGGAEASPGEQEAPAPHLQQAASSLWHTTAGRLAFGLPVVAAIAVVAVLAATALPFADGTRRDPRNLRDQAVTLEDRVSPLVEVKRQLLRDDEEVFTVGLSSSPGAPPVDRLRVATLEEYDGALWRSGSRYVRAGAQLPEAPPLRSPAVISLDVTVTEMPPPYLPTAGRPVAARGDNLAFDEASGVLVTTERQLNGYHYAVEGITPGDTKGVQTAGVAAADPAYTRVPFPLPAPLQAIADQLGGQSDAYPTLEALAERLREQPYSNEAPPGHAYASLLRFADSDAPATAEQTATAFALIARSLDFPTRIAVGYRVDRNNALPDGRVRVMSHQAHAWPEVLLDEYGWVAFEPTNPLQTGAKLPPQVTPPAEGGEVPDPGTGVVPVERADLQPGAGDGGAKPVETALTWLLVLVILVVLALAGVFVGKLLRRRRRRSNGTPGSRIVGAWRESTDRLRENGVPVTSTMTATEVADIADRRLGAEASDPVRSLTPLVNDAVFGPEEPEESSAEDAWVLEEELRALLEGRQPVRFRARSWLDPRPLLPAGDSLHLPRMLDRRT